MGTYIAKLRKSHNMSQKELADKLNITDKAISKWERGLSCPDISLLAPLSAIFGISVDNLINGDEDDSSKNEGNIENVFKYAEKAVKLNKKSLHNIFLISFSAILFIGIVVCAIIDVAISGSFSWSLIPIASCVFTFIVFAPSIKFGERGIVFSLIALTIFVIPFLFVLNNLIESDGMIISIGFWISIISIVYLWIDYILYKKMNTRIWLATAIIVFLAIPLSFIISLVLSKFIYSPVVDVWDIMTYAILFLISVSFFIVDRVTSKRHD